MLSAIASFVRFLPVLAGIVVASSLVADEPDDQAVTLWYRQPATKWTEALPLGNGRLGAMVFGSVAKERLHRSADKTLTFAT